MRNIHLKTTILIFFLLGLFACEKDEIRSILNTNAVPTLKISAPSIVLTKDGSNNDVLTVTWEKPNFGYDAGPSYAVLIDKKGGDFSKAYSYAAGLGLSKTFKGAELNTIIQNLGLQPGSVANLDIKVQVKLSDKVILTSALAGLNATSYVDKLDLSSPWGVVGSAFNDWGATADAPFYKTATPNVFVSYVLLKDGEYKIRKNNDWAVNYGDDAANGTLEPGGANIIAKAGYYKITFDASKLTVKSEKYIWGVVGSAYNDWGATADGFLSYDPFSDQWRGILKLKDGELKIRQNSDWAVNLGDNGNDGTLEAGGANIAVKKGNYLVTFSTNDNKYTIEKVDNVWGVVGSGYNDWGASPDFIFALDYEFFVKEFNTKGLWIAKNVKLKDGEIKFRANEDWAVNYGDDGGTGVLKAGGANIAVKAGLHDISLDFSKPSPTYKIIKK